MQIFRTLLFWGRLCQMVVVFALSLISREKRMKYDYGMKCSLGNCGVSLIVVVVPNQNFFSSNYFQFQIYLNKKETKLKISKIYKAQTIKFNELFSFIWLAHKIKIYAMRQLFGYVFFFLGSQYKMFIKNFS